MLSSQQTLSVNSVFLGLWGMLNYTIKKEDCVKNSDFTFSFIVKAISFHTIWGFLIFTQIFYYTILLWVTESAWIHFNFKASNSSLFCLIVIWQGLVFGYRFLKRSNIKKTIYHKSDSSTPNIRATLQRMARFFTAMNSHAQVHSGSPKKVKSKNGSINSNNSNA